MLKSKIAQFAETEIQYDENLLDERQKIVVDNLYQAAKLIDELFLDQVYAGNFVIRERLMSTDEEIDKLRLKYFDIMFGPFDRLDDNKPFFGIDSKPPGANFYPEDMSKEEFETWIKEHPEDEKAFTSEFTLIDRRDGKLTAVPYSENYSYKITMIANFLRSAAEYADNPSLKKYLLTRADGFKSNDYYESDMAWMDLKDNTIEVVIGPYEVYEDGLFNFKASFECFITIVDPVESKKLEVFAGLLNDVENNLPIPDKYKNFERGSESPIVVVQEIFSAGDCKAGIQTLAFNLPNDERVRKAKGSKKVMLKNIHEAKFEKLLYPIAQKVMDEEQFPYVTFNGFFNHTLMHEISHGVGPGFITIHGRKTEVKKELKETYSILEECKADVLGMYNDIFMIKKGVYPLPFEKEVWATFLAGTFRSVRFGVTSAHGGGNAIIYNYLLENGAYEYNPDTQQVKVNFDKIYNVVKDLANKLLTIQATGNYEEAKKLIEQYAVESPSMKAMRDKLSDLPVDIRPIFQIEKDK
ncbi:MAG: peptidase [Ignavibacteria bacterium RBG_13_36_8]|nr:MAG: peptidase [Ignavibacteria bacterium RBG_13_36_8]